MVAAPAPPRTTVPINPPSPDYFIPDRFKGKTIIVTGCARGMGAGAARRAAREGTNVVGVDGIKDLGAKTISDIVASGGKATLDGVFSGDEIDYQKQKPLIFAPIHEATDDYWDKVFRTNSGGVFRSMRAELRQMVTQGRGGTIVNVASIAGMTGLAGKGLAPV